MILNMMKIKFLSLNPLITINNEFLDKKFLLND